MIKNDLYIIGLPIGNIKDITLRAIEVLQSLSVILCEDTREFKKIAAIYKVNARLVSFHDFSERDKIDYVINLLKTQSIGLVSDRGTPVISDPGFVLIKQCLENKISIKHIPGVSAITTIFPICNLNNQFTFIGFIKSIKELEQLKYHPYTMIFFSTANKLTKFLQDCYVMFGNRKVCIGREMTKIHEEYIYFQLSQIPEVIQLFGEFTVCIEGVLNIEEQQIYHIEHCLNDIIKSTKSSNSDVYNIIATLFPNIQKKELYKKILEYKVKE